MPEWALTVSLLGAVLIGFFLGRLSKGGHNWWQEMTISNNSAQNEAVKVLADRYALGEIDANEFHDRVSSLKAVSTGGWHNL